MLVAWDTLCRTDMVTILLCKSQSHLPLLLVCSRGSNEYSVNSNMEGVSLQCRGQFIMSVSYYAVLNSRFFPIQKCFSDLW